MSSVFISWGSPDHAVVGQLRARLTDLGITLFEYSHAMDAGDRIDQRILDEISQAEIAIVCLSDVVARREWILTEVAWIHQARTGRAGGHPVVIPVAVGRLNDDAIPHLLRNVDVLRYDPHQHDDGLERLVRAVGKNLWWGTPVVIPAALFAMTRTQFDDLPREVTDTCRAMYSALSIATLAVADLRARYGDTLEDYSPFTPAAPLVDIIHAAIRELNNRRVESGTPPIFLRWVTRELYSADTRRRDTARDDWRSLNSLVIVDSLSTYSTDIQAQLNRLPDTDPDRTAVVWLPPYTHITSPLEQRASEATSVVDRINDFYRDWVRRDWGRSPVRWRAFDLTTCAGLWHWLYWMCDQLVEPRPHLSRVDTMKSMHVPPPFKPHDGTRIISRT